MGTDSWEGPLTRRDVLRRHPKDCSPGAEVQLSVRPEKIRLDASGTSRRASVTVAWRPEHSLVLR